MSFHGGVMGVIVAMIVFSRQYKINFYRLADEISAVVPIGLGL
jgi:phosphatidylglycerol:prolipoprotein diacylglycerol transferase